MDPHNKIRVLIVEDDMSAAEMMRTLLERQLPADVSIAPDSASAMEKLEHEDYDVVTVDYWLDKESGLELLEDINEGEDNPPVVVVTSCNQAHLAARSFELGAAGYVVKDYSLPRLLSEAVRDAISKAAAARARDAIDKERSATSVVVNELDEIFFVTDMSGRLTSWNRKLREVTGLDDGELHLRDATSFFLGSDARLLSASLFPAGKESKVVLSLGVPSNDGGSVPHEFTAMLLRAGGGRTVGICGLGRRLDGTGPADRSGALPTHELHDLTAEIIIRVDENNTLSFVNEEAARFWGAHEAQMLGTDIYDLIHPDDFEKLKDAWLRAVAERRSLTGVVTHLKTARGWRYLDWNAVPIFDGRDGYEGFQVTGRDITERELTERFLRQVNRALDEYAHTVSHDLRGPLSAIMLAADTLRLLLEHGDEPDATVDEMARIISENAENAGALVRSMLDLAERAQLPQHVEELDVGELVARISRELAPELAGRGVSVVVDDDLGRLVGDATQVYQVFSNLMTNAVRHSDREDGGRLEVRYLGDDGGCHKYLVRDNGSGIPEDDIYDVFKPFFKGGGSSGHGIGLAVVEKTVKLYGGFVRAYNDEGACFEFGLRDYVDAPEPQKPSAS